MAVRQPRGSDERNGPVRFQPAHQGGAEPDLECECRDVLARRFDDAADGSVRRQRVRSPLRAERRVHERAFDWPPANGADQGERRWTVAPVNRSPFTVYRLVGVFAGVRFVDLAGGFFGVVEPPLLSAVVSVVVAAGAARAALRARPPVVPDSPLPCLVLRGSLPFS